MKSLQSSTAVAIAALLAAAPPARAQGFGFKAPAGWLDLSPSAPSANFAQVTPELAARARNKDFIFFAADVERAKADGFLANANAAYVSDKPVKVTKEFVEDAAKGMGEGYQSKEKTLIDVGGVTVGKLVGELSVEGKRFVQVSYLLPGEARDAILVFTTIPERLPRDAPGFEASVRATTGLVEPAAVSATAGPAGPAEEGPPGWVLGGATGVAVAIGLAINAVLQRRRNRNVWGALEPVLRQGPATLGELTEATGMTGLMAKGKLVLALQEATTDGRLDVQPAPEGTPQLDKVKFIKYSLRA